MRASEPVLVAAIPRKELDVTRFVFSVPKPLFL